MCFSAPASFIAGAALSSLGVVTVTKVQEKKELPFALLPLLFGIQQLAEGFVWLTLQGHFEGCNIMATNIFAFFAYAFWPIYIPFAIWIMEKKGWRRMALYCTQAAGLVVGGYLLISMFFEPFVSQINHNSIAYLKYIPWLEVLVVLYGIGTVGALILSSRRFIQLFGVLMALTATVAYWHYFHAFESVWCFFAAVLSIMVCAYFWKRKEGTIISERL